MVSGLNIHAIAPAYMATANAVRVSEYMNEAVIPVGGGWLQPELITF